MNTLSTTYGGKSAFPWDTNETLANLLQQIKTRP